IQSVNSEIKTEDEVVEIESTRGAGVCDEYIESYLIGLIEDEVKKGNRPTTTLTKPTWKFIRQKLKEKTTKEYSQEQLKNKYNLLRKKWKEFSKLLEETGIGYNVVTYQLTVEDAVWNKLYEPSESEDEDNIDGEVGDTEKKSEEGPKAKKSKTDVNPKKLRERVNIATADALFAMSENSEKKLELLEKKINTLSTLEGVDGASFAKVTKLLLDDPSW
ncbi:L10-interacting MYB domain-containing protein, partial [Bienertia sinuspersici]